LEQLQRRDRELVEAQEQQTATAEILGVMSRSPTNLQPVLDSIAQNAARVCGASDALIRLIEGNVLRLVAHHGPLPGLDERIPLNRGSATGRAISDRQTIHLQDLAAETIAELPIGKSLQDRFGHRTVLAMPLLREGVAIGGILIRRQEVRPFSDKQIQLLRTFADQAVIAIQNVRLFKELQARNTELTDTLARQTATSEILRVISSSPTDVQPVFDTIARNASALCGSEYAIVFRFDGERLHLAAQHNARPDAVSAIERLFPRRPGREISSGRAILERAVVHIPDVEQDPEYSPEAIRAQIARSYLAVPMLRDGAPIGTMGSRGPLQGHLPPSRSRSCRPLPTRRSSPSRMCGSSPNWRHAIAT
jgi:two-component system NtrC family sensor kinase